MTESELVMILIVQDIEEISKEWMDIIELRKSSEDPVEFIMNGLLSEFDLSHVETSNTADGITRMHDCWGLSLCLREHNIDHVLGRRDRLDSFENVLHCLCMWVLSSLAINYFSIVF